MPTLDRIDAFMDSLGFQKMDDDNYVRYYFNPKGDYTLTIEYTQQYGYLYSSCVDCKWSVDNHDFADCFDDMMLYILEI